ncbi:MAG: hypothetical protein EHM40_12810 [Chloroflexi bacterium]|nr:MAG: hypothetical protein EHM40_12810 [Chloroflexota bacterium]
MSDMRKICVEIAHLVQTYLDLERWKFKESARVTELSNTEAPAVIYDSQWCRIRIEFAEWAPPFQTTDYAVDIYYGRLHAPNHVKTTVWNGEECWCWHSVSKGLHFLDGRTPEYTAKNIHSHDLLRKYQETTLYEDLRNRLVEWEIRKHIYIWKHYAPRLFELFDVRQPNLWEQYRQFLKEMYDIKGRRPNIKPPLDKVC